VRVWRREETRANWVFYWIEGREGKRGRGKRVGVYVYGYVYFYFPRLRFQLGLRTRGLRDVRDMRERVRREGEDGRKRGQEWGNGETDGRRGRKGSIWELWR